ncbi:DeoR/GlpR family DNA-binding transcription regulator [Clostridium uliginosum]|uniref:DeoR family transcriptional regulator, glycerol-3-phosphate regulon repressor n=1 Tax=Clostridium uliginosum TaxID=119641 RepID=A0A1I1HB18_9CLOT|nr:DeoR/GlpR family DNA-binding transcription regulator [Clostridium uliginosum]SFC20915.1 DeoR family transcriptional regulator, glycerol-3-phosphate regulon repressor [Clostridium uliginosum]
MFAEERLDEILNLLNTTGKIKVKDLSLQFNVSEDCIRKDLKSLENKGFLKRTYGGAVQVRESSNFHDMPLRQKTDISTKTIIAQKALDIIEDRETIFLDLSTINILIAKLLRKSNKNIIVVTNMLEIMNILSNQNNITLVATGGVLNKDLIGFTGASTIEFIKKYKFDKVFIGSCGIDVFDRSITTFDIDDGITKSAIIESSKKCFLVMENKKFHIDGNYKFAKVEDVDTIITDSSPSREILDILNDYNINVM